MGNTLQKLPQIPPPNPQQHVELQQQPQSESESEFREFTCEICIEPTDKKFINNGRCSHPYCTDCVIKYIRIQLDDNNVGDIKCPALNCDHTLDAAACAAVVGPAVFARWCDVLCESAILGFERCYCPYSDCNVLIVDECGGKLKKLKKSKCPNCKRWFCFECGRVWHAGFGCEENGEERDGNDVAFGTLVEQEKWMRCPHCRHFVELVAGCRYVKCRCKTIFCYKCGKQACTCDFTSRLTFFFFEWCFVICALIGFVVMSYFIWRGRNNKTIIKY